MLGQLDSTGTKVNKGRDSIPYPIINSKVIINSIANYVTENNT